MSDVQALVKRRIAKLIGNITEDFRLDRLSKSPARFNLEKLNWFNREYIKMMSLEEFVNRANTATNNQFDLSVATKEQYLAWLLDKNRITVLSELGSESDCILDWSKPASEDLKWKKISLEESLTNLKEIKERLLDKLALDPKFMELKQNLLDSVLKPGVEDNFQEIVGYIENQLKTWLNENGKDVGSYLWPLRLALSGKTKSPSPFELLTILTPEQVDNRIQDCLQNS